MNDIIVVWLSYLFKQVASSFEFQSSITLHELVQVCYPNMYSKSNPFKK